MKVDPAIPFRRSTRGDQTKIGGFPPVPQRVLKNGFLELHDVKMSKSHTPSEHSNLTTKIGSKMGGKFTYPKMCFFGFDPQPSEFAICYPT